MSNNFKSVTNHRKKYSPRQALSAYLVAPCKEFLADPAGGLLSLGSPERTLLNYLIPQWERFALNGRRFYLSQTRIGKELGFCRQRINKAFGALASLGLVTKHKRYDDTSVYTVSRYFYFGDVRARLAKILSCLRFLPLALLTTTSIETRLLGIKLSHRNTVSRGEVMSMIPDYVRDVKIPGYNLTLVGRIKLSAFTKEAIEHAQDAIEYTKKEVKNPYMYFMSLCLRYTQEHDLEPNWALVEQISQRLEVANLNGPDVFVSHEKPAPKLTIYEDASQMGMTQVFSRPKVGPLATWKGHTSPNTRSQFPLKQAPTTEKGQKFAEELQRMLGLIP